MGLRGFISNPLCGHRLAQHIPAHIGPEVFTAHQATSGGFDLNAAALGDGGHATGPLVDGSRRDPEHFGKVNLTVILEVSFEVHAFTLALLTYLSKPC